MGRSFAASFLGALLGLTSCHPKLTLTPKQLDDLYLGCQARSGGDLGARPVTPGDRVGLRTPPDPPGTPVVVYGASWCSACHVAAQYMTRRGIPFVERDIEEDPSAQAALEALGDDVKLPLRVHHALPIIDVRGTVMVGFVPCFLEQAWAAP